MECIISGVNQTTSPNTSAEQTAERAAQTVHKMGKIITVKHGRAVSIRIDPSLNGAKVQGWILAKDRTNAFLAAKEVSAKFERESIGAWIDVPAGDEAMCPFEFDVPRGYVYPDAHRQETFEEIQARILPLID